jgi:hypothetical protein
MTLRPLTKSSKVNLSSPQPCSRNTEPSEPEQGAYLVLHAQSECCLVLTWLIYAGTLQVVAAVRADDFAVFFDLYRDAPRMVPYLMDAVAARVR